MTDIMAFNAAVEAVMREASERAILPRFRNLKAGEVEDKGGNDPVTVADREAEDILTEGLSRIIPGLPVVGEEAAHADKSVLDALSGDCWIVDPLDGTRNFAHGKPPFGVIVAMASGGVAHTGWIYDCLTHRLCVAHKGKGAFVNNEKVFARTTGQDLPVAAISLLFMDMAKRDRVMEHVSPFYDLVDVPYCAAEQYPRLALGENDVSLFERTLAWDHAAGVLWLNEAGGRAARPDGSEYRVDGNVYGGLIGAASPALWEQLAARMDRLQD
jgi:fructose-1,6-bisphosphatase/inositol monophosphatase family enzyme